MNQIACDICGEILKQEPAQIRTNYTDITTDNITFGFIPVREVVLDICADCINEVKNLRIKKLSNTDKTGEV